MNDPELFVVCRSCGKEVSPYITECPYCGNRLRKRATLGGGGAEGAGSLKPGKGARAKKTPKPPKAPRRETGRFDRERVSRRDPDRRWRPWGTILLVLASIATTVTLRGAVFSINELAILEPFTPDAFDEPWRLATTLFVYVRDAFEAIVLGLVFLFGWLLERRHGAWAPVLVFLLAGAAGSAAATLATEQTQLLGAQAAALGLVGAWSARALLDRRDAEDRDMLGVLVAALLLLAMPIGVEEADPLAGVAGGLVGLALGVPLARMRER
jgi:membrane associated rhomboid family serine protease